MKPTRLTPLLLSVLIPLPLPAPPTIPPPEQEEQAAPEEQDNHTTAAELEQLLIDRATTLRLIAPPNMPAGGIEEDSVDIQFLANGTTRIDGDSGVISWTTIDREGTTILAIEPFQGSGIYITLQLNQQSPPHTLEFELNLEAITDPTINPDIPQHQLEEFAQTFETLGFQIQLTPE